MRGQLIQVPVLEARRGDAGRPLRLEEPAGEPAVVLGRRLSRTRWASRARCSRTRTRRATAARCRPARIRSPVSPESPTTRAATTSSCSPTSCARPRRRRATPRSPRRPTRRRGEALFNSGRLRHLPHADDRHGAAPGTVINGGAFRVPAALGNKMIHPFTRLPAARRRHRRRHRPERRAADAQQAAHRAAVGPARPRPVHARRGEPELRRRDRAARRPGGGGARQLQRPELRGSQPRAAVPVVAVGNGSRACAKQARPAPSPRSAVHADGSPSGGRPPLRSRFSSLQRASRSPSVFS